MTAGERLVIIFNLQLIFYYQSLYTLVYIFLHSSFVIGPYFSSLTTPFRAWLCFSPVLSVFVPFYGTLAWCKLRSGGLYISPPPGLAAHVHSFGTLNTIAGPAPPLENSTPENRSHGTP